MSVRFLAMSLLSLLISPYALTGEVAKNPVKLATQARLDLLPDADVGILTDGEVVSGNGYLARMTWKPKAEREQSYMLQMVTNHFSWSDLEFRFTPTKSGKVQLSLKGMWEESKPGTIYQGETLWDDLQVKGTELANGGFELDKGWVADGGRMIDASADLPAPEGNRYARTWHDATLNATLVVQAGVPVSVRLKARSVIPDKYEDNPRLKNPNSPAHQAAKRYLRGANFGNLLEAPPGKDWGAKYSTEDFKQAKAEGFDHIRLPVAWHYYAGPEPDFMIKDEIFARVDAMLEDAYKYDLNVILDIHHFDPFTADPAAHKAQFFAMWKQLAEHYANAPDRLALELLNEPVDKATTQFLNPVYAEAIKIIRKTNPKRTLFVGPGKWNSCSELVHLRLPADDDNLIVTVHCYEPFFFTHQGAFWAGDDVKTKGIIYPGPPTKPLVPPAEYNLKDGVKDWIHRYNTVPTERNPCSPRVFKGPVRLAQQWSEYYGRPVHMGEFGVNIGADVESRVRFLADARAALEEAKIGWAIWDYKAYFRYWDPENNRPIPGMREAIFPNRKN